MLEVKSKQRLRNRIIAWVVLAIILIVGLPAGYRYWVHPAKSNQTSGSTKQNIGLPGYTNPTITASTDPAPPNSSSVTDDSSKQKPAPRQLTDAEKHKIVSDLMGSYRTRNTEAISQRLDAGDVATIEAEEKWVNRKLRQQGNNFRATLKRMPQARPKSRGIVIEGCTDCMIDSNIVRGFDEGISIKNSPGLKARGNEVSGPEPPKPPQ
jgi:parallel beta-helix repeat protein